MIGRDLTARRDWTSGAARRHTALVVLAPFGVDLCPAASLVCRTAWSCKTRPIRDPAIPAEKSRVATLKLTDTLNLYIEIDIQIDIDTLDMGLGLARAGSRGTHGFSR